MTNIDEAFLAERERIHGAATGTWKADELMADAIVDALDHQPALIAEIRRLRAQLVESDEALASAESELGWRILQKDQEDA